MFKQEAKKVPKNCYFCANGVDKVDYKDILLTRKFINSVGKILPRRRTTVCAKHQRLISQAVKRARIMGLLPFSAK